MQRFSFPLRLRFFFPEILGLILLVLGTTGLFSCKVTKEGSVFMTLPRDTSIRGYISPDSQILIREGDVLAIQVSSLNKDLDERFNAASVNINAIADKSGSNSYQVGKDGNINLHYIGNIQAVGKTTALLADELQKALLPYFKEPIVRVQFQNHRITVMGQVNRPQVISLGQSPMSFMEALAMSGDLKEEGDRKRIMIIRDSSQVKQIKYINLENHEVLNSSWYYTQPNDIIYVMTKPKTIDRDEKKRNLQTTLSVVITGLSFLVILLDRIIK